ncbi:Hypothetical predicted protein [Paramuricea clavata]|uniref:Uncharacterized protein n=1 Tax=Paramuricea clavata TaxID=317549 RepID=A0A6S7JXH1_PARCT|nr:Hypothetical predicted protein [Paramuricea clavata]
MYNSKTEDGEDIVETAVSCDGTWQRRGFTLSHRCVTVISMENGKMLDVEPLSKVSKACIISTLVPKQLLKSSKPLVINSGAFCVTGVREADRLCVTKSSYKPKEKNKVPRNVIRGRNKRKGDKNEVEEEKHMQQVHFKYTLM